MELRGFEPDTEPAESGSELHRLCSCVVTQVLSVLAICLCVLRDVTSLAAIHFRSAITISGQVELRVTAKVSIPAYSSCPVRVWPGGAQRAYSVARFGGDRSRACSS